ncbi:MAG: hypothetical protein FJ299_15595 [Planctomycetes bacterium]|nr:hypothetical protein [Planctomycetota bacterium]
MLLALLLTAANPNLPQNPASAALPELPRPPAAFAIAADAKLMDVLRALADSTGQAILVDQQSRTVLETTATGLLRDTNVPPAQAWPYVQSLLAFHGAQCSYELRETPTLVAVRSPNSGRGPAGSNAVPVLLEAGQTGWLERHPGFWVRTSIKLPNTDVRQLVNSLRAVQTQNLESVINAGESNVVIVTGFGSSVLQSVQLLRLIDEQSARHPTPLGSVVPGTSGAGK